MMDKYTMRDLDRIMKILGTTQPHLWLFSAGPGDATSLVPCMGTAQVQYDTTDEAAVRNVNAEFGPVLTPSGLYAYHFQVAGNQHIKASADHADHSFANGTVDSPFSLAAWVMPASRAAACAMLAKSVAGQREWEWTLAITTGKSTLVLTDESANATETGTADIATPLGRWSFMTVTYDGTETAPVVNHYMDGSPIGPTDGATTESGSYVAMENGTTPLLVAASGATAAPASEFHGYMFLPMLTGKALTAAEVEELYQVSRRMLGV